MESQDSLDCVKIHYHVSLHEFGTTSHGVLWSSEEEQMERFENLIDLLGITKDAPASTFNDFGCGYGAFFHFLQKKEIAVKHYYGYDFLPSMLEAAKTYIDTEQNTNTSLILSRYPTHKADYTIISGTFNLCDCIPRKKWKEFIFTRLLLAFSSSTKGLAFNGLSLKKKPKVKGLFYSSEEDFLTFCEYGLGAKVQSSYNTKLNEWNIALFKTNTKIANIQTSLQN